MLSAGSFRCDADAARTLKAQARREERGSTYYVRRPPLRRWYRRIVRLLQGPLAGVFGGVHLLPFFTPIDGADAGFDPVDHTQVDAAPRNVGRHSRLGRNGRNRRGSDCQSRFIVVPPIPRLLEERFRFSLCGYVSHIRPNLSGGRSRGGYPGHLSSASHSAFHPGDSAFGREEVAMDHLQSAADRHRRPTPSVGSLSGFHSPSVSGRGDQV